RTVPNGAEAIEQHHAAHGAIRCATVASGQAAQLPREKEFPSPGSKPPVAGSRSLQRAERERCHHAERALWSDLQPDHGDYSAARRPVGSELFLLRVDDFSPRRI